MTTVTNINDGNSWQDTSDTWASTSTWGDYSDTVTLTNVTI